MRDWLGATKDPPRPGLTTWITWLRHHWHRMTRPESVGHPLRAELLEPRDEGCRRSPITLEGLLERRGAAALCEEEEDDRELATSDDVLPAVAWVASAMRRDRKTLRDPQGD